MVVRGVLNCETLSCLLVDDYQREALDGRTSEKLDEALCKQAKFPDIELGMRGDATLESNGELQLLSPVFIIDGQQRVRAAIRALEKGLQPQLGALVHFNTSKAWERERFRILNLDRTKVSPNVLLRNTVDDSPSIKLLYKFSQDLDICIGGRVTWGQKPKPNDLISSVTLVKTVCALHLHAGAFRYSGSLTQIEALDEVLKSLGEETFLHNIWTYFGFLDEAFGVRSVKLRDSAPYLRNTFLTVMADVFSEHTDFWDSRKFNWLLITQKRRQKLANFPVNDPNIRVLCGGHGQAMRLLRQLMVNHLDSGKRSSDNRLKSRYADKKQSEFPQDDSTEE